MRGWRERNTRMIRISEEEISSSVVVNSTVCSNDFYTFKVFFFEEEKCRNEEIELNIYHNLLTNIRYVRHTPHVLYHYYIIIYQRSYVTRTHIEGVIILIILI